ncbi:MAG: DUF6613 domain-containing protein [Candidatus Gastranaerophilaceae bacterium]
MEYHVRKTAFTLAEVLITLGIIGVVAAFTLPVLVTSYKKNVIETRLAAFYSKINQAIKSSEVVNGDKKYWESIPNAGYETGEDGKPDLSKPASLRWFDKYLRPYLKVQKVVADKKSGFTVVYMMDGSCFRLAGQAIQFYPQAKDFTGSKINSDSGIKYFTFYFYPSRENAPSGWEWASQYHYDKGIEPYKWSWDGDPETLKTDATAGCNKENNGERAYCTEIIFENGWKIPGDYPLF